MNENPPTFYINSYSSHASLILGQQLCTLLQTIDIRNRMPVILCVGSDRVTGDSLGPFVGSFLTAHGKSMQLPVYGTLRSPVHALNLANTWKQIKKKHPCDPIIAVDASLGTKNHLGYITLGTGSLKPGSGVFKTLPLVGDFYITGIVNTAVPEASRALQNTRLSCVADMAFCISQGLLYALCPQVLAAGSCYS